MNRYKEKVEQAMQLITDRLSENLKWDDISRECGISSFHFHRIFTSLTSETPRSFLIRKRLEKAVSMLVYGCSDVELADLALECGYSSQANFSKAFKNYFGVTPSEVKENKEIKNSKIGKIKSKYGKDFNINHLYPNQDLINVPKIMEVKMKAAIKTFSEREIVFETSENGYIRESITRTWESLLQKTALFKESIEEVEKYGIGYDNPQVTPMEKCRYDACVLLEENDQVPSGLKKATIPAGKFACFHFKGSTEELLQFYLDIYKNWFSDNGYEVGDFPLIERYLFIDKDNPEADFELETQFLLK